MTLTTPDGEELHGLHVPPARAERGERLLVLGFAGNAWNSQDVLSYLHQVYPAAHVVAFHYRGYRPSTGRASARALLDDARLIHDAAVERVGPDRTVAVGFSIGSGVAASLASAGDIDAAILVTPFDSLKAVAADLYPMLPIGPFFQHEMNAAEALRDCDVPVAIIAAEEDAIVTARRTQGLREAIGKPAFDRTIARAGHNDIYYREEFQSAMREALAALVPNPVKRR